MYLNLICFVTGIFGVARKWIFPPPLENTGKSGQFITRSSHSGRRV